MLFSSNACKSATILPLFQDVSNSETTCMYCNFASFGESALHAIQASHLAPPTGSKNPGLVVVFGPIFACLNNPYSFNFISFGASKLLLLLIFATASKKEVSNRFVRFSSSSSYLGISFSSIDNGASLISSVVLSPLFTGAATTMFVAVSVSG